LFCRSHSSAGVLLLIGLLFAGCGDAPQRVATRLICDAAGSAALLHSKLDDDDGDGLILDEHHPQIDDEDDDIADHAWMQDRTGLYHLFFQNEGKLGGNAIEHYVSADLHSLTNVGVALAPRPGKWDSHGLWAPHIIQAGRTYYMFYTGIDGPGNRATTRQRIGVATSTNLLQWTRLATNDCPGAPGEGCVYECIAGWTPAGGPAGSSNQQCRDAFVLWDGAKRRWVMFATAKSIHGYGVVTVAYSSNLIHWRSAGYLDATRRLPAGLGAQATGGQAENPFVVTRGGTHRLFFTDWQDSEDDWRQPAPRTIVQWAAAASLVADSSGSSNWVYRGSTPDPGVNAFEVLSLALGVDLVSQSISNPDCADHELHRRELRLKRIVWQPGGGFRFEGWPGPETCARAGPQTAARVRSEAP
jgi:hypothetical protein